MEANTRGAPPISNKINAIEASVGKNNPTKTNKTKIPNEMPKKLKLMYLSVSLVI